MKLNYPSRSNRIAILSAIVFAITSLPTLLLAATDTNEVWISARTNALGTGMIAGAGPRETWGAITNPFYGDFDAIVSALSANTTIHLLPGIHHTKGYQGWSYDLSLKAYQRILGAGIDVTTVMKDSGCSICHNDNAPIYGALYSTADGVQVSDLTVDCNGQSTNTFNVNGIVFSGNYCSVRRTRVINAVGNFATGYFSSIIAVGNAGTKGNVIEECQITNVVGTYCFALQLNGQGAARANRVVLPILTSISSGPFYLGYLVSSTFNSVFDGNYCEGGNDGFYSDGGSETNLTIANNNFKQVFCGIVFNKSSPYNVNGVLVVNNSIELSTNLVASAGNGITFATSDTSGTHPSYNMVISGNTLSYINRVVKVGTASGGIGIGNSWDTNFNNVRVVGNTIDRSLQDWTYAKGNWFANNTDLQGIPLHVRQIGSGNPSSVSLGFLDGAVFVTANGTTAVSLPNASGLSGKEVTIVNQHNSGLNLTVNAVTGNTILPSGPVTVSAYQTAKFISDGSSTWVQK